MDIIGNLNEQQKTAVTAPDGQTLVIAGAGSGKTRVLVSRAAWLIQEKQVPPLEIMAVTFTNKAAREMKERLAQMSGAISRYMWIGTFHSLCGRLLRLESRYLTKPLDANFNIYDDGDSRALIKKSLAELGMANDKRFAPHAALYAISEAKTRLKTPEDCEREAANPWQETIARIYRNYQRRLLNSNALDFDDLLFEAVALLRREPEVLAKYSRRFKHILVDEYQDTNHSQYNLVKLLTGQNGNLFVVGDPDQSIYRWRGAEISNILDFSRDYPDCLEVPLTENYRSRQNILDAANALISHNHNRKPKDLFTSRGAGELLRLHQATDDREEAFFIIDAMLRLAQQGFKPNDCAVLYRTHSQSRVLEDQCRRFNVPYRVYGGQKFYERKEVKDTLAYLRFIANERDTEALNRIYNEPKRGIGKTTWDKLAAQAAAENSSIYGLLADLERVPGLATATAARLRGLYAMMEDLRLFAQTACMKAILERLWSITGYRDAVASQEDGEERLEILDELFNTAAAFDTDYEEIAAMSGEEQPQPLTAFLGQISLATDMDTATDDSGYLTLMTLHAAKGLEFPVVFICGLEDGVFPHQRVLMSFNEDELEEERRLLYVGITRGRELLFLSAASRRLQHGSYETGRPSRFLAELPQQLLEVSGVAPPERRTQQAVKPILTDNVFVPRIMPNTASKPAETTQLLKVGDKVHHSKFGDGVVVSVSGGGEDMQLSVAFPGQGVKQLMWRYAPLKKI